MANERHVSKEVRDEYLDTMSKIYFSYFKGYLGRLMKLQVCLTVSVLQIWNVLVFKKSSCLLNIFEEKRLRNYDHCSISLLLLSSSSAGKTFNVGYNCREMAPAGGPLVQPYMLRYIKTVNSAHQDEYWMSAISCKFCVQYYMYLEKLILK